MIRTLLLILLLPALAHSQIIPPAMRVDWSEAGNQNALTHPSNVINVLSFGAAGDSITDNSPAFASAVASLNGNAGVILVPPGNYLFLSPLVLADSVIIRGSSSDSTNFYFDLNGAGANCISIEHTQSNSFVPVLSGYTKGSDSLVLGPAAGLAVDDIIEIRQQNGTWDIAPAPWAAYSVGQLAMITSINGNTIHLDQEIRIDYDPMLAPEIRKVDAIKNAGIECLRIHRLDQASSGYNISFSYSYNCWVKGVESSRSAGAHVSISAGSHTEITGSYFHHAFAYDGASTRGYGVMLAHHASDCLIADNIFEHLRHAMIVKQGANGNVFAYNYSIDPYRTEIPHNAGGDISLHGHYAYANLFEGNIVQNIHIDKTWGPSGPYNTFFRNRAELYGIFMSQDSVSSDMQSFVGNEVTHPSQGLYILSGTGHFEHGNNIDGTITPSNTNTLTDNSYYLSAAPSFWSSSTAWPSIGIPSVLNSGTIPAKQRLLQNIFTACASQSLGIAEAGSVQLNVFPNPFSDVIHIELDKPVNIELQLTDITGRIVWKREAFTHKILVPATGLPDGIYILKAYIEGKEYSAKIIRAR